ncbi:hypothetical protein BT67DRAFT_378966 [Trichocladium antarcticum]|uniref:Late endosomal/lysosomal adaptor and MAPK and MTOR activator-domain-containing protein n=1 Tax=Trichocladium antarcticum TaxID=1450529 RepID=A0AAN6ULH7_9PEZI|nr:hypothetical protein BT67DRAFT_378966 [Trichocladium antarcticum]
MGNCSSCLGNRRRDDYDEVCDDEAQHLFDDPNNLHYGSFNQQHMMGQEDPQEVQREIEALQRVVARTSDNMVDIYDIVPHDQAVQPVTTPYAFPGQDPTVARYHTLLSKLSSYDDLASVARVDWGTPDDEIVEMQQGAAPIKKDGGDVLVGNFADAAAAMR